MIEPRIEIVETTSNMTHPRQRGNAEPTFHEHEHQPIAAIQFPDGQRILLDQFSNGNIRLYSDRRGSDRSNVVTLGAEPSAALRRILAIGE